MAKINKPSKIGGWLMFGGIACIVVWALLSFLWVIGIILLVIGFVMWLMKK